MFGRRRHAAMVPVVIPARLSDERIFELVHARLMEALGPSGSWTVVRRTEADTDSLFRNVLTRRIATEIAVTLTEASRLLESEPTEPGQHAAPVVRAEVKAEADLAARTVPAPTGTEHEPAAFSWQPAPITVWTDLRKPVTGELAQIREPALNA